MTLTRLVRYGSLAAMLAGAFRTISSFVPDNAASVPLEWFYLLIDVCLLLGLLSLYLYQHEQVGRVGFAGFLPALIGTASIMGLSLKPLRFTPPCLHSWSAQRRYVH